MSTSEAAAELRKVADEIDKMTAISVDRYAHERDTHWMRRRAHQLDGQHDPHPSLFVQALDWLGDVAVGQDETAAQHARRLIADLDLGLDVPGSRGVE